MRRDVLRRHARAVLEHELRRAQGRLGALPDDARRTVEEASWSVTGALVDALLAEARSEPAVAEALASIYGPTGRWDHRAALWVAD
jgi:hypothetical protein